MTEWTKEEDEAFNDVEKQSNLGKQILKDQGQPYHWSAEATKAAVKIEREECARIAEKQLNWNTAVAIRARGNT
jgi:hypothetical protein